MTPSTDLEVEQYLRHQEAHLGPRSTVFVDERDGEVHGFTLCYEHGDAVYSRACGFDPRRATVELGSGSYQGKRLRGADVTALWSVVVPPDDLPPECARVFGRPAPQALFAGVA